MGLKGERLNKRYKENFWWTAHRLRKPYPNIIRYGVDWRRSFRLASDILGWKKIEREAVLEMKRLYKGE